MFLQAFNPFPTVQSKEHPVVNTHQDLLNYFLDRVQLTEDQKKKMRGRRNANRDRLKRGLEKNGDPAPLRFVKQGSYAMHTMVQANADTSDIDDGAVFKKDDLKGARGGEYSALDAKQMVRNALDDGSFKKVPEVRTNCVRVYYDDGFTVDVPVYREVEAGGRTYYELAGPDWKESDPEAVTDWFNRNVNAKSPDTANGRQMRRLVRLLKAWSKSWSSWNLPSGFVLSILTNEAYFLNPAWKDRDDQAFLAILSGIHQRVTVDRRVYRPVSPHDEITKSNDDANMRELRDRLKEGIETLAVLLSPKAGRLEALKAYRSFFSTDYFDVEIAKLEKPQKAALAAPAIITSSGTQPLTEFIKRGGEGQYA
jgi:hypothetical protein